MIRLTTVEDTDAILNLAVVSGLFSPDSVGEVAGVLKSALQNELGPDHLWLTDDDNGPVGVAYVAPERMAVGTWNLYMLAIHPDRQRQGRGAALVSQIEQEVRARGGRLLLIETSGLGTFERTRTFYRSIGYHEEARIREFYKSGDDKVIFCKSVGS